MFPAEYETDSVFEVETNLDDMNPEILGNVCELLRQRGALDVWTTAIQMKKQRQGTLLSLLCTPELLPTLTDLVFRETSAFGLRVSEKTRLKLRRDFQEVSTVYGSISVKRGFRGETLLKAVPEYESCKVRAHSHGVPLQTVYLAAQAEALKKMSSQLPAPAPASSPQDTAANSSSNA